MKDTTDKTQNITSLLAYPNGTVTNPKNCDNKIPSVQNSCVVEMACSYARFTDRFFSAL